MGDFSANNPQTPLFIGSLSMEYSAHRELRGLAADAQTALTWVTDLIIYVPFVIPFQYPVRRVWWSNGSTITTSNADVGVYSLDGVRLCHSGTTALVGASAEQNVAIAETEILLDPGIYYLAYVCDSTTARVTGTSSYTTSQLRTCGVLQQTVASALLPTTMTPIAVANALYPTCGITRTSSGF